MGRQKESSIVRDLVTLTKTTPKVRHIRVKDIPKDSIQCCTRAILRKGGLLQALVQPKK